jgi:predicted O-methyltransferase YrrM
MRIRPIKSAPGRGSHLPVLMKLFECTTGPVLELGCGMYSTCYLHWACFLKRRQLVTYEAQEAWMGFAKQFENDFHTVKFVSDWDALDVSAPWSVVLVDHDAGNAPRWKMVQKLLHADYVVCHDSERPGKYGYDLVFPQFAYQYQYRNAGRPYTTVVSNVHDLSTFTV